LAIAALFALALRAADAQQFAPTGPPRRDPYVPQVQPPPAVPNQSLRYPLPTVGPAPNSQPQSPTAINGPPVIAPATSMAPITTAPPLQQAVLFAPGQIVARVGDKTILYADVAPIVAMRLEPFLAKARNPAERQAMEAAYRDPLMKNVIDQLAFNKMLLMEFERSMPPEMRTDAKKRAEAEGKLKKQIQRAFDEQLSSTRERLANASQEEIESAMRQDSTIVRLALLMKQKHLESPGELDVALRQYGTSLAQQVKEYGDYMMGMEAAQAALNMKGDKGGKGSKAKKEITHQEMLDYFQAHINDYYIPAKSRFEILTAKFSKFAGDRKATYDAIARMGNEVFLGGIPFPAVARKCSQEPHASEGGYYDWVTPGSLASKPIDQALFSLEVDKLSQIIEDEQGFHIVHVLERKPAGQVSFQEAQPGIRDAIKEQRSTAERQKYLADVRNRNKVWTIFDPPTDGGPQPPIAPR
jgi:parvulin-like peptidyl-prolyl isomerase